jgi:hypothetical protein
MDAFRAAGYTGNAARFTSGGGVVSLMLKRVAR